MKLVPSIEVKELRGGVYQFILNRHVYSFLVVGESRALLIDTGWGMADLKKAVRAITPLPLTVVNTHGHYDHVFGNYQFDEVFIHEEDLQMMKSDFSTQSRRNVLAKYDPDKLLDGITGEDWVNAELGTVSSLNEVATFDLGSRVIDVIETPGHTKGSVCFLDRTDRLLFTGDTLYKGYILLHFNLSARMPVYLEGLKRLRERKNEFDYILPGHGKILIESSLLDRVIAGVEKILSGECKGEEGDFYNRPALTCRFDDFLIVYREDYL